MDKELFIKQVGAMQNALRSFLLALCCGRKADADDIAQETLIKAYMSMDRYVDSGRFKCWLLKIAYNTFLNHRAAQRQYASLDEAVLLTGKECSDGNFAHQQLYLALSTLPARERTAISLFYLCGYSIKEISKITGCSEAAVKKQLSRGRDRIKNSLSL